MNEQNGIGLDEAARRQRAEFDAERFQRGLQAAAHRGGWGVARFMLRLLVIVVVIVAVLALLAAII